MKTIAILIAVILSLLSPSTLAAINISDLNYKFNNLSEEKKVEIAQQILKLSETNSQEVDKKTDSRFKEPETNIPAVTSEKVDLWVTRVEGISIGIGKAIAGAAKEVGIGVNEFVKTDVGMIVSGIIIYKLIGKEIIDLMAHLLLAAIALCVFPPLWYKSYKSIYFIPEVKRITNSSGTKQKDVIVWVRRPSSEIGEGQAETMFITGILISGILIITLMTIN